MKALSLVSSITGAGVGVAIVSSSARNRADIKRPLRRCRLWCSAKHWDGKGLFLGGGAGGGVGVLWRGIDVAFSVFGSVGAHRGWPRASGGRVIPARARGLHTVALGIRGAGVNRSSNG